METILISSPLLEEEVERIRAVAPDRVRVIFEPSLLPPMRYPNDHKGAPFQRTAEQQRQWDELLPQATILWDLPKPEDRPKAGALRWIQTTSTGVGQHVVRLGLQDSDILITTARGSHGQSLAEFVFLGLLMHFRQLRYLQEEQRAHRWERYCVNELPGKVLVIVGAGDLARGTAHVAKAFGMHVVAVARNPDRPRPHDHLFAEIVPQARLHEVLGRADAVVLTVPHTPETEDMIDAAAIAAMKPGLAFVNIARGQIVDEDALIEALRRGHIGFAALDVTRIEPLPVESPLWDLPNVLISPHSASTPLSENDRILDVFVHNLRCWVDGRVPEMRNVLDKKRMY
jgi:phosphoglycerate dehydrogenase-like enzyme